jgi:hypothetical protein
VSTALGARSFVERSQSAAPTNLKGSKSYQGIKGLAEPPGSGNFRYRGTPEMACPSRRLAPAADSPKRKSDGYGARTAVAGRQMAPPVYSSSGNARAFWHLRFVESPRIRPTRRDSFASDWKGGFPI